MPADKNPDPKEVDPDRSNTPHNEEANPTERQQLSEDPDTPAMSAADGKGLTPTSTPPVNGHERPRRDDEGVQRSSNMATMSLRRGMPAQTIPPLHASSPRRLLSLNKNSSIWSTPTRLIQSASIRSLKNNRLLNI